MKQLKILIVEDELIAAESLTLDLEKLGYQVCGVVNSGEKAIEKVNKSNPDLILMDIMLKGKMDGISTAQIIYSQHKVPIIYLSAYGDKETLVKAKSTPVYGYLVKPYKIVDVNTTITMAWAKYQEDLQREADLCAEKKINQIKTQALATASHDLRTPLTNILGYTELIRDYGDRIAPDKKERYFNFIKSAVVKMTDSLEDLLLISKAEEGKITLYPQTFNIVEYLSIMVDEYNNLTENHTIELYSNQENYQVYLDQKILNHIFNNLLSNAIKYSPDGGRITLNLFCEEKEFILEIEDKGIGMPKDYQAKLFTLFERGSNVGSIKGNGLGLSIVKKAVELHGGKIEVKSKENEGTKFTVKIPLSLQ
ncbi:ATP-binding protein [Geminocystis sp. NIES-3709]|uniref:hybrid sensor histidine kinase/response regulator n=1 Tax=Geminocystis sp. NIES-3709 TaxID=1617448 RepID=UPI0005FCAEC7|nr:ATP-binding protein [Geminocystis sp. NIES-3709]BAQ65676.1 diguanylate cyclase/phosphodiesterase with PAS/PAC sensor [Geminocystis sp. NIES-3709]